MTRFKHKRIIFMIKRAFRGILLLKITWEISLKMLKEKKIFNYVEI